MSAPSQLAASSRRRVYALTWLTYALYYFGRKGASVTRASMAREFHVDVEAFAWIDAGYLAAYAVGQFISGYLGDRLGARKLLALGSGTIALALLVAGGSPSLVIFGAAFVLNGLAQSTGWPGTTKAMAQWTPPEKRGAVMGLWATCYQVGGLAATAFATRLLTQFNWRASYFGPALLLLLLAISLTLWLPSGGPEELKKLETGAPKHSSADDKANAEENANAGAPPLWKDLRLWSYGLSYFSIKLIRYSLLFWLPYFLNKSLHYSESQAGYVSTAFEAGGVAGAMGIGRLSDRIPWRGRGAWSLAGLALLVLALLAFGPLARLGMATTVIALALIGLLLFGPDSLISGAAAQDLGGGKQAASATGFVNGVGSVGAILQGFVTVHVTKAWGFSALFYVFMGLACMACLGLLPAVLRTRALQKQQA